jgi:hypothetical protein
MPTSPEVPLTMRADDAISLASSFDGIRDERSFARSGGPPGWSQDGPEERRRDGLSTTAWPVIRPANVSETLRVDGKVPAVIHKLEYIGWNNSILTTRQSDRSFKHIPEIKGYVNGKVILSDEGDVGDDDSDFDEDGEPKADNRPVIEIITKVFSQRRPPRYHRGRHNRAPRMVHSDHQPITAAFDDVDYPYTPPLPHEDPYESEDAMEAHEPFMLIHSEHLRNAIKAVVTYYPNTSVTGAPLHISSPYRILYHHRDELAAYSDNQPAKHSSKYADTTTDHINVLLDFLDSDSNGKDVRREEELHQLDTPMATYDYFWLLLKPGEIVYAKRYDIWTPFVVSAVFGGNDAAAVQASGSEHYQIDAWYLESNGTKVDRFMETFKVMPWHGEQAINSLSVIPAAMWAEDLEAQGGRSMRDKCIAEGRHYWELLKGPVYMDYDGLLVNSWTNSNDCTGLTGFMSGRVICDAAGFSKYYHQAPDNYFTHRRHSLRPARRSTQPPPPKDYLPKIAPQCGCEACDDDRLGGGKRKLPDSVYVGLEDLDPLVDSPPENADLFFLVLSGTIPGFVLGHRRWGHLNVAHLKPLKTDKEAFKYLVLDDDIKTTVKALIGKFASSTDGSIAPWGNDFVKNKGEGRIFLLHGSPGVGKTCTAECIAEQANRPLISLTSGDLSTDSYQVEQNLSYFFELGQRYGALVLLDEADVYLERRRSKDIARNGLVSIFLRALEYYRGLLIITTNRVQSFDGAFLSRIHVALHYKNLGHEDRERIWANNFDRLARDSSGRIRVSGAARDFVWTSREVRSLQWNGREIRNAMQTALALAESDAQDEGHETVTIAEKHVRAVVKLSKGFRDFIKQSMPPDDATYGVYQDTDDDEDKNDD